MGAAPAVVANQPPAPNEQKPDPPEVSIGTCRLYPCREKEAPTSNRSAQGCHMKPVVWMPGGINSFIYA
jgi:hypothetical protein